MVHVHVISHLEKSHKSLSLKFAAFCLFTKYLPTGAAFVALKGVYGLIVTFAYIFLWDL